METARVLSLGAGIQSSTLALMYETGELSGWDDAVEYDRWLRSNEAGLKNDQYLHRSLLSLDEVDFVKDQEKLAQLEIQFKFKITIP